MTAIEPLRPDKFPEAAAILLAAPGGGRRADHRQVRAFLEYVEQSPMRCEGLRSEANGCATGLFMALLLPGSTAIAMVPTPRELGIDEDAQRRVTAAGIEQLELTRPHYIQALLDPQATGQRDLLLGFGFRALAPLVYLERSAVHPWVDPPPADAGAWVAFHETTYARFAATLLATYEQSQDCPELTGLRPIDDVIAAHEASGRSGTKLWELLCVDGRDAGCLLLSQVPNVSAAEVVYMGVVPDFRRRGVATVLLRRALQRCRDNGIQRLTLVVDDRNEPAKRLYDRFGMRAVARRDAYLYRPRRANVEECAERC